MMPLPRRRLLLLTLAAAALPGWASHARAESEAERCVRAGDAPAALAALESQPTALPAAEAAYWKARALVQLERLEEAAALFAQVPSEHKLHAYAARGVLYCAWRCPQIDFPAVAEPLISSPDAEVATLALAALAEYQLRYANTGGEAAYQQLLSKAAQSPELLPALRLMELAVYRNRGDFVGGIEHAKLLEQDTELSPLMRQRVRLELAELYYAKEAAAPQDSAAAPAPDSDEGKGEETLLQFITAHPETPLLEEAFRRLYRHVGTTGSEYARARLRDWAEDTAHPKRAALALYTQQQMAPTHGADPATLANRAAAELPGEPLTCVILQEHIRKLFARGKDDEAAPYISLLANLQKEMDARSCFLSAWASRPHNAREAMALFGRSAETADAALLTPARVNSLICAMQSGDAAYARQLLQAPADATTRRALLLAHAGMLLEASPALARREVEAASALSPTAEQQTDIRLDLAQLRLTEAAAPEALRDLLDIPREQRRTWTEAQQLRYAALLEKAADATPEAEADALLERLYEESDTLPAKEGLALRLAERLAAAKRHEQALHLLLDLAQQEPPGAQKAAVLLFAGRESACLGSLPALEKAAEFYAESARQGSPLAARAKIEQAATLVRINRTQDALSLLHELQQQQQQLSPSDQAHMLTVLADAYALDMTPQSLATALEISKSIEALPELPAPWRVRGYLQHAALCTRQQRHEEALADYQNALQAQLPIARAHDARSCFLLYYAAAGAIYQLMQMERYDEAATLADAVAAWPGTPQQPAPTPGPKAEAFKRWAQNIRQTHFLPLPAMEQAAAPSLFPAP